jgi:hypothetical protein
MKYIPLESFSRAWIFKHPDAPITDTDLALIKPLSEQYAEQIWSQLVSDQANHPDHFAKGDWAFSDSTWLEQGPWQDEWEKDGTTLPALIQDNLDWDLNTVVYFCYDSERVVETSWDVFRRSWKNFLFYDDGPVLVGKRRKEVLQFLGDGQVRFGRKA